MTLVFFKKTAGTFRFDLGWWEKNRFLIQTAIKSLAPVNAEMTSSALVKQLLSEENYKI